MSIISSSYARRYRRKEHGVQYPRRTPLTGCTSSGSEKAGTFIAPSRARHTGFKFLGRSAGVSLQSRCCAVCISVHARVYVHFFCGEYSMYRSMLYSPWRGCTRMCALMSRGIRTHILRTPRCRGCACEEYGLYKFTPYSSRMHSCMRSLFI